MIPESYVWLEDVECPNCLGVFLFAEDVDEQGAPTGEVRCCCCGFHSLPVIDIRLEEDRD